MLAKLTRLRLSPAIPFMTRRPLWLVLGCSFLLLPSLLAPASPLVEKETIKLSSGHTVKVLSISKIESSKGTTALLVRYETNLSIDERKALSEEVDALWKVAVKEVEKSGYSEAVISSNEVPKGVILTASRVQNFIYEKDADGNWTRLGRADFMAAK